MQASLSVWYVICLCFAAIFWLFYDKRSTPWWILPQANARLLAMSFTSQSYLFSFPMMIPCEWMNDRRTCRIRKGRQKLVTSNIPTNPCTGDVKYTHKPVRVGGSGQRSAYIEGQKLSMMTGICFAASLHSAAIKCCQFHSPLFCFKHLTVLQHEPKPPSIYTFTN